MLRRSSVHPPGLRRRLIVATMALAALALAAGVHVGRSPLAVAEQNAPPVRKTESPRYTFRRVHDPNGIGKFYMGREIARVMGHQGAEWLERPEREREERLSLLIKSLQLKPGMHVADIGCGSGVVTLLLAEAVGDKGRVYAVDIQPEMLDRLKRKLQRHEISNVRPVLGTAKSPRLKPASVDLVLLVDVYHEFAYPYEMMLELARAVKPGGRIVLVEYRKEDPTVPIKLVHKMTEAQVKRELSLPEFQLKWKQTIGVLPRQHIIVFERQMPADEKRSETPEPPPSRLPNPTAYSAHSPTVRFNLASETMRRLAS